MKSQKFFLEKKKLMKFLLKNWMSEYIEAIKSIRKTEEEIELNFDL